jgi:hypothetical protein
MYVYFLHVCLFYVCLFFMFLPYLRFLAWKTSILEYEKNANAL